MGLKKQNLFWFLIASFFRLCAAIEWSKVVTGTDLTVFDQANDTQTFGFYQQRDGSVSAFYRNAPDKNPDTPWSGGDNTIILPAGRAVANSPLAAVHYVLNGVDTYHLFYLATGSQIKEIKYSGSTPIGQTWATGPLDNFNVHSTANSRLAAVGQVVNGSPFIALFYQANAGLFEIIYSNGAWAGSTILLPGSPASGTRLAFTSVNPPNSAVDLRGYYQGTDGKIHDLIGGSGSTWSQSYDTGTFTLAPNTAIAVTAVRSPTTGLSIRFYAISGTGQVVEFLFNGSWYPANIVISDPNFVVAGAGMSAISYPLGAQSDFHVYMQTPTNIFTELRILGQPGTLVTKSITYGLPGASFAQV